MQRKAQRYAKDGIAIRQGGYISLYVPDHPRATKQGRVLEHIIVAERTLGRCLLDGEVVHHINHITSDNRPENLMVLGSNQEHSLLHARERALAACGNADWRKCRVCKQYDDVGNLSYRKAARVYIHLACERQAKAIQRRENGDKIRAQHKDWLERNPERRAKYNKRKNQRYHEMKERAA